MSPRVLLTGAHWIGDLLTSCERALQQLGLDVAVVATNQAGPRTKKMHQLRTRLRSIPGLGRHLAKPLERSARGLYLADVEAELSEALAQWRPDVLLALVDGLYPVLPELLARFPNVCKIGWLMDDPFYHVSSVIFDLQAFDLLYTVEASLVAPLQLATGRPVAAVPLAADPEAYHPLANGTDGVASVPLVFVGKSYRGMPAGVPRQNLLRHLVPLGLAIWGDVSWKDWVVDGVDLGRCYRGGPIWPDETNRVYNGAAAVINIHHPQIRSGTSLRTFSICASGAFQLVDWRPGLEELLEPGREVIAYSTGEELAELAQRYLRDPAERRRVAAAGLARVRAEHTYAHRLQRILSLRCGTPIAPVANQH